MRTITKKEFEAKTDKRVHGDFWNTDKLAAKVFRDYPEADSFKYDLYSGLYAEVTYMDSKGSQQRVTVYDN